MGDNFGMRHEMETERGEKKYNIGWQVVIVGERNSREDRNVWREKGEELNS